jgi:transcriptional regulator with XRE-family HTH domain
MPDLRSSSPAKRALAAELRRMREISGMSGDEVAGRLHWSPSKISRIETNRTGVKGPDLNRLLDVYDVDEAHRGQLSNLANEPDRRGWWNAYSESIGPEYTAYISLEDHAAQLQCWSPELIHGLLQTEEYAQAIMAVAFGSPPSIPPRTIQDRIQIRLRRQEKLIGSKRITFILDEAALLHQYGTAAVMRHQLAQLVQVSKLPDIHVRVLPFNGPHPVVSPGAFAILEFAPVHDTTVSDIVYVELLTRDELLDQEADAYQYQLAFDRLSRVALDPDESRQLIKRTAEERWS